MKILIIRIKLRETNNVLFSSLQCPQIGHGLSSAEHLHEKKYQNIQKGSKDLGYLGIGVKTGKTKNETGVSEETFRERKIIQ
jgi:hypothetical protein